MSWEGGACSSKDHHSTGRDHLVDLSDPVGQSSQTSDTSDKARHRNIQVTGLMKTTDDS